MQGINELAATSSSSGGFNPTSLILILVVVVAFYMLMIRPQQRKRQQAQQQQNTIQPGARVRTTAGMYATVVAVDGDDVVLEVAPGVEARFMKRAVMDVVSPGEAADEDTDADDETTEDYDTEQDSDDDETTDEHAQTASADSEDSDETAYEQATGTKHDYGR